MVWKKFNPNPTGRYVQDCSIRAVSAALGVSWDTASDMIYRMAKSMGTTTPDDAAWGAVLRQNGFYRAAIPNTCPDCFTVKDFCLAHPKGVYVLKTSGHVVTVIDGQAWDTWDSTREVPQYYWYLREE